MAQPERQTRVPIAILGAGLTGMSAAYHLAKAGLRQRLFEKLDRPGGHAVTSEEQGYRFDRTGHLLHLRDPELEQRAIEWMGPGYRRIERRSVIWSNGVYTRYPFQANLHGLPPKIAYECLLGYLEAREAKKQSEPREARNFADYCYATFGKGISDHFMIPYNARLWGVPPTEISADWCQRFVPVPTLEDVIAGAVGLEDRELGYNARFLYPNRGIGQLSEGLARELGAAGGSIELGRAPVRIDTAKRELVFVDERVRYGTLVSTVPLPVLLKLCADAPEAVRDAARRLRCTQLFYLDVALDRPCGRPYHWIYVPEWKYPFYRVGCYSHFSPEMAPSGKANLYVELCERDDPDLDELLPEVARGLCEMRLIDRPEAIAFARLRRIDYAYVVFDHDYQDALDTIQPFLAERAILSTGRYGGWNYSSMGDALGFGRDAAKDARALLASQAEETGAR